MADAFAAHRFTSRQAGELYAAWRDASPQIRQRILEDPQLFLKAQQQVEPQPRLAEELLRDLTMVIAITNRASRRLARAAPLMNQDQFDAAERKIACAVKDLEFLTERIQKEQQAHVEQRSTDSDSGASCSEGQQGRDRQSPRDLPFHRTQNPAIAVLGCAGTDPIRESGTLPAADSGGVGQLQGLIDNTHVVVLCGTGRQMIPVPEMEAFDERFGFQFRAHELGDANRSGRVERPLSA